MPFCVMKLMMYVGIIIKGVERISERNSNIMVSLGKHYVYIITDSFIVNAT